MSVEENPTVSNMHPTSESTSKLKPADIIYRQVKVLFIALNFVTYVFAGFFTLPCSIKHKHALLWFLTGEFAT
jgi:hypothetical protein